MTNNKRAVVALGGNAITREFEEGNISQQFSNTRRSLLGVLEMIKRGYLVAITHGNGPQVGNALIRVEAARDQVPPIPLGVLVADLGGGMGYMIGQSLQNKLIRNGITRDVVTIQAQVIVDKDKLSIAYPTKFVGPFYPEKVVERLTRERNWILKKDSERGWRRVVPALKPMRIVEQNTIRKLFEEGSVVITMGGGGIPVYIEKDGTYEGVDGVIDKDFSSAVLAKAIGADELYILTAEEKVYTDYKKPGQKPLDRITVEMAKNMLAAGQFPPGSMGPKIMAAIQFLESGGEIVVITSVEKHFNAMNGETGTRIVHLL